MNLVEANSKMNLIKDEIRERQKALESVKASLSIQAKFILPIMQDAEIKAIAKNKNLLDKLQVFNLRTITSELIGVSSLEITPNYYKFTTRKSYCGGDIVNTHKIPAAYFEMSEDEIRIAHTKFSEEKIKAICKRSSEKLLKMYEGTRDKTKQYIDEIKALNL